MGLAEEKHQPDVENGRRLPLSIHLLPSLFTPWCWKGAHLYSSGLPGQAHTCVLDSNMKASSPSHCAGPGPYSFTPASLCSFNAQLKFSHCVRQYSLKEQN